MIRWMVAIVFLGACCQSWASNIPRYYHVYATKHGVPVEVFFSVVFIESGRKIKGRHLPWPWTLNVNHKAYYYDNKEQALAALKQFLQNPKNTIAVGLGQIYLPSHGKKFEDPLSLLDPHVNLDFASQLLRYEFHQAKQKYKQANWWLAAGRYHHPSKEHFAKPYRERVFRKCQKISHRCRDFGEI